MIIKVNKDGFYTPFTTGIITYWKDFCKIIMPFIAELHAITFNKEYSEHGIFSFFKEIEDSDKKNLGVKGVRVLHTPNLTQLDRLQHCIGEVTHITHYKNLTAKPNRYTRKLKLKYIPMSIDTEKLPNVEEKNGKIVYFANITPEKSDTYTALKEQYDIDTISYNVLNYDDKKMTNDETLRKVAEYSIGIGVGRCALEMIAMGLKVIVAGRKYSGCVTAENFDEHWESNFNSDVLQKDVYSFKDDIEFLQKYEIDYDAKRVDMNNFKYHYLEVINEAFDYKPKQRS